MVHFFKTACNRSEASRRLAGVMFSMLASFHCIAGKVSIPWGFHELPAWFSSLDREEKFSLV
jgi:hypothetical protein